MNKRVYIVLFASFITLFAKEPTLAILQLIPSNTEQIFTISQKSYFCKAYGVIGFEKLTNDESISSSCRKKIEAFNRKNPNARFFADSKLNILQRYHIEYRKNKCLLFAAGEITLSELLLREGVALLEPIFKDEEYGGAYKKAQEMAKIEKKGLWKDGVIRDCIAELYKR